MADKKQNTTKQKPAHVVRCGEVTAIITSKQSNAGYSYFDFSLGRCWKSMATGREAHGASFFADNEQDLVRAIHEVCEWLRSKSASPGATDVPDDHQSKA